MSYRLVLEKKAVKAFKALDNKVRSQIRDELSLLEIAPTKGPGIKRLSKPLSGYRLRSGNYRILYTVHTKEVIVYSIAHRKDAYR